MNRIWPILTLVIATALIFSACRLAQAEPTAANDWLSSAVPATLTAIANQPTLTSSPTETPQPTSTPSPTPVAPGLQVVYSKAGSIWIWRKGGEPKRLTFGSVDERPRISDDGKIVAFKRGNELYVVNSDGSNFHKLVSNDYLKPYLPRDTDSIWPELYTWLPNSHFLYFTTMAHAALFGVIFPDSFYWDLFQVEVDSGVINQILPKKQGGVPYFSPDGKWIAVVQPEVIYVTDPNGENMRRGLAFDATYGGSEGGLYLPNPVWLQDGHSLGVAIPTETFTGNTVETNLWNIPIQGDASIVFSFRNWWSPGKSLAPDGMTIQYTEVTWSDFRASYKSGVHRQDSNTETPFVGEFISWSLDSSKIVLGDMEGQNRYGFKYMDITTGNITTIITAPIMVWIDNNRYLYLTVDYENKINELFFATIEGPQIRIDQDVEALHYDTNSVYLDGGDRWSLPFDFSN